MSRLTAMIADDEPLARMHLRFLLDTHGVDTVGEAQNAAEALRQAEDLRPDIVFLDIQMPDLTGMQVAAALLYMDHAPLVVFVTGYSEHALAAFENDALDYLVKPVTPERLAKTLARARARLAAQETRAQEINTVERLAPASPLRRLPIREDYAVRLVRVEEIVCATAREKRVYVRVGEQEHRTYYSLTQLESLLPSELFLRIHDSCLVNLDQVEELLFLGNHSYMVRLTNGLQLPVGRTRYAELQRRLGLDISTS